MNINEENILLYIYYNSKLYILYILFINTSIFTKCTSLPKKNHSPEKMFKILFNFKYLK